MENEILELLSESCKKAPEMTHLLKVIGDGDMKKGMLIVIDYFKRNERKKGIRIGITSTLSIISLIVTVGMLYATYKEYRIRKLEQNIAETNKKNEEREK